MITKWLRIGVITQPHGIKGEVKVYPTTDDLNRFKMIDSLVLEKGERKEEMKVEEVKYFKGMAILKLSGLNSIEDAEKVRQADLYIKREQSSPCKEGEYFVCDLIDMDVLDEEGRTVGKVQDVMTGGANAVIVVRTLEDKEILIPKAPGFLLGVDLEGNKMTIHVPEVI